MNVSAEPHARHSPAIKMYKFCVVHTDPTVCYRRYYPVDICEVHGGLLIVIDADGRKTGASLVFQST